MPTPIKIEIQNWLKYFSKTPHDNKIRELQFVNDIINANSDKNDILKGNYKIRRNNIEYKVHLPFDIHKIKGTYYIATHDKTIIGQLERTEGPNPTINSFVKIKKSQQIGTKIDNQNKKDWVLQGKDGDLLYKMIKNNPAVTKFVGGDTWYMTDDTPNFVSLPKGISLHCKPNGEILLQIGTVGKGGMGKANLIVGRVELDENKKIAVVNILPKVKWEVLKKITTDPSDPMGMVELRDAALKEEEHTKKLYPGIGQPLSSHRGRSDKVQLTYGMPLFEGRAGDDDAPPFLGDPLDKKLEFCLELMHTVDKLHNVHGLVHRDLKFGNVIYDVETQRLKLIDLGVSVEKNSKSAIMGGTVFYMAPECWEPNLVAKPSEDIFTIAGFTGQMFGGTKVLRDRDDFYDDVEKRIEVDQTLNRWDECKGLGNTKYDFSGIQDGELRGLFEKMADFNPAARPSATEIVTQMSEIFAKRMPEKYKVYLLKRELNTLAEATFTQISAIKGVMPLDLENRYNELTEMVKSIVKDSDAGIKYEQLYGKAIMLINNYIQQESNQYAGGDPDRLQNLQKVKENLLKEVPRLRVRIEASEAKRAEVVHTKAEKDAAREAAYIEKAIKSTKKAGKAAIKAEEKTAHKAALKAQKKGQASYAAKLEEQRKQEAQVAEAKAQHEWEQKQKAQEFTNQQNRQNEWLKQQAKLEAEAAQAFTRKFEEIEPQKAKEQQAKKPKEKQKESAASNQEMKSSPAALGKLKHVAEETAKRVQQFRARLGKAKAKESPKVPTERDLLHKVFKAIDPNNLRQVWKQNEQGAQAFTKQMEKQEALKKAQLEKEKKANKEPGPTTRQRLQALAAKLKESKPPAMQWMRRAKDAVNKLKSPAAKEKAVPAPQVGTNKRASRTNNAEVDVGLEFIKKYGADRKTAKQEQINKYLGVSDPTNSKPKYRHKHRK